MTGCTAPNVGVPKPGTAGDVVLAGGILAGWLETLGFPAGTFLASLVGAVTYHLTTFCPAGPVTPTAMTTAELVALLGAAIISPVYSGALQKLEEYLDNFAWYQLCDCSGGPAPIFQLSPALPTGISVDGSGKTGVCQSTSISGQWHPGMGFQDFGGALELTGWTPQIIPSGNMAGYHGMVVPLPFPDLRDIKSIGSGSGGDNVSLGFAIVDASGNFVQASGGFFGAGEYNTTCFSSHLPATCFAWPAQTKWIVPFYGDPSNSGNLTFTYTLEEFGLCKGSPVSPCCTTSDPTTLAGIMAVKELVTLIQRQAVPFAYVPGTLHSGLTGAGTLTVSGILGVSVALSSLPSFVGQTELDPTTLFNAGQIAWGTTDGFLRREFVTSNPYLSLPPEAGAFTRLGYSFPTGITGTIQELVREP